MDTEVGDKLQVLAKTWKEVLDAFFLKANLRPGQILVLGCSTSEVK